VIYRSPEPPPAPAATITPEIRAAIAQREAKVLADVQARNLAAVVATHKARNEAGSAARCRAIQARIFQQVAVGGIRINGQ
jgi:hypothetical protein